MLKCTSKSYVGPLGRGGDTHFFCKMEKSMFKPATPKQIPIEEFDNFSWKMCAVLHLKNNFQQKVLENVVNENLSTETELDRCICD